MNILAIADRPPKQSILKTLAETRIDLICTLGDLEFGDIVELTQVKDIPKIGVYGNHCSGNYFESLGIKNMHLQTLQYQGFTFGGFEGSVRYKASSYAKMYTQEEAQQMLKDFPHVDVMLAHCPPSGINDELDEDAHAGFIGLREYIEREKPQYLLHGHTYPTEATLITRYQDTEIVYVYQDRVITIK
ncbi:metallophosphoesterase [Patescibacteria group bacterium]|nr:metallophosphoesterase [Patescibacteria group bacterium]